MPDYIYYPAVDADNNFPPEVRTAIANYLEMTSKYAPKSLETSKANTSDFNAHTSDVDNPHAVTKAQVGLGNVNNTSDMGKPLSSLQQAYIDAQTGKVWSSLYTIGATVGFVGDSYMTGLGMTTPSTDRWPKQFTNLLSGFENNVAVSSSGYVNEGVGGNSKFSTQASLLATDCDHVIVCGGINDAPLGLSAVDLQTAFLGTISAIRDRIPNVPITVISPMWGASAPSSDLLLVESRIRIVVPTDVTFIEGGPWMRIDRTEWQQADGHPNTVGGVAIAKWVRDQFGGTPAGSEFYHHVVPGTADKAVNTTNFPGYAMGSSTILGAKSGWWTVEAQAILYNTSNGYMWIKENARKVQVRADVQGANPMPYRQKIRFYHPGGDLPISYGFDPSTGSPTAITNGQTFLKATYDGVK